MCKIYKMRYNNAKKQPSMSKMQWHPTPSHERVPFCKPLRSWLTLYCNVSTRCVNESPRLEVVEAACKTESHASIIQKQVTIFTLKVSIDILQLGPKNQTYTRMEELLKEPKQQETTNNHSIECYFYSKPPISLTHVSIRAQYHIYYKPSNEWIHRTTVLPTSYFCKQASCLTSTSWIN